MAATASAQRSPSASARARFLSTTPGRLRVESIALAIAAVLAGLLASFVVADQASNSTRIAEEAEPAIVAARRIQTNLAEANAEAATAFLAGGVENPEKRAAYLAALDAAAVELERATSLIGDDEEAHAQLALMTAELPRYAGLIETARANNRQGYPVGAAYLDEARALLDDEIYPATDNVANQAAADYRDAYNRLRGLGLILGVVSIALIVVVVLLLVYVQMELRRRFRRTFNLPILAATVVAVAVTAWLSLGLAGQLSSLTAARVDGYEGTRLYLDLRGTAFQAKADEARFLIAFGAGEEFESDFTSRAESIAAMEEALINHAEDSAGREAARGRVADTYTTWTGYRDLHDALVTADRGGERTEAVDLALGPADAAFADFDTITSDALDANQARFEEEMASAERAMRGLRYGILAAVAVIAGLALYGLQLRINEYR